MPHVGEGGLFLQFLWLTMQTVTHLYLRESEGDLSLWVWGCLASRESDSCDLSRQSVMEVEKSFAQPFI